jgi:hypothetical protein
MRFGTVAIIVALIFGGIKFRGPAIKLGAKVGQYAMTHPTAMKFIGKVAIKFLK